VKYIKLKVIIADNTEEKVELILTKFLVGIGKGLEVDKEWIEIEVGDADWVENGDSILKSKIAVELEITFKGSVYVDRQMRQKELEVSISKER